MEETKYMIPLRSFVNKILVATDYARVDLEDFDKVSKIKWSKKSGGYAQGNGLMHRFVMNAKIGDPVVNHVNGDKLDNRKCVLNFVTVSQNSQNRIKKKGIYSSDYTGVSQNKYEKEHGQWRCHIRLDKLVMFLFSNEQHAAYYYDVLAKKHYSLNGNQPKLNNVERPIDFIEPGTKKKLSEGVFQEHKKFRTKLVFDGIIYKLGLYNTEKEASDVYQNKKKELEEIRENERQEKIKNTPIKRNEYGQAIIEMFNKNKEKIDECIVDDDKFHHLLQFPIYLANDYASIIIDGKSIRLHRYLMESVIGEPCIDHINKNPLDNRLCNLRVSNDSFNIHNKTKKKNASSKYYGVYFAKDRQKFVVEIAKDKIKHRAGVFVNEEDAARAADKLATELYGSYANLNFLNANLNFLNANLNFLNANLNANLNDSKTNS